MGRNSAFKENKCSVLGMPAEEETGNPSPIPMYVQAAGILVCSAHCFLRKAQMGRDHRAGGFGWHGARLYRERE